MKLYVVGTHRCDSSEYTQHTIIVFKIEKISLNKRHLLPDMTSWLSLSGSNYPYLEQIQSSQRCSSFWGSTVCTNKKTSTQEPSWTGQ